jgi:VCBS repeat-containing protein
LTATASVSPTGDPTIDGVLNGVRWGVTSLTFSFPTSSSYYEYTGESGNNFKAFTAVQRESVRDVLANYAAVSNLTFSEVTETSTQHATLRYAESDSTGTAWGYYPSTSSQGGDTWFNNSKHYYDNPVVGNYAYLTMLHETGHALGLKHPHEVSGSFSSMPLDHDSLEYSVMSYRSYTGASTTGGYTNASTSYPQTLMMLDIAAIQEMYGANFATNGGDTVYKWSATTGEMFINGAGEGAPGGNKIFMTVWDGGGHDTYDFSNYATNLKVDLSPGGWTTVSTAQLADLNGAYAPGTHMAAGNIANALLYKGNTASLIEDVIGGSGNDRIIGNVADNHFTGGRGSDYLDGGSGTDTAIYSGLMTDYSWVHNADGSWTIADLRAGNPDATDTLWNIELLQFGDTIVTIDSYTPPPPPVISNNAPIVTSAAASLSLAEWADKSANEVANISHTASGAITYSDADIGDVHSASFTPAGTGYVGTFTLNTGSIDSADSVGWSFAVSDSAVDYLKAGQSLTQKYNVAIDDGHGGTTVQTVTITLTGADDAATKAAKGNGRGNGNDFGMEAKAADVLFFLEMQHDQAPEPYQSHLPAGIELPEVVLNGLAHLFETTWHV